MTKKYENDQEHSSTNLSRRSFVTAGLGAIAAVGCLSVGLKEALAQARTSGKPVFTQDALNELFADERANKALAAEASRDVKAFIRSRFTLAKMQIEYLEGMSKARIMEIQAQMKAVAKKGGPVKVAIEGPPDGEVMTQRNKTITVTTTVTVINNPK